MKVGPCPLCGTLQPVPARPLTALAATPGKLLRLTRRLMREELLRRPAPGKWSIHEIACHLADVEVVNAWRCRKVLAKEEVGVTAWDQDRWAAGHQYRRQDLRLTLEQFRSLRARNVALLRAVGRTAWARTVTASTFRTLSAGQIAAHLVHHDANHVGQIERIRKTLKSREPSGRSSDNSPQQGRPEAGGPAGPTGSGRRGDLLRLVRDVAALPGAARPATTTASPEAAPPERGRRGLDEARRAEGWSWWGRTQ